jgi:iron complex outermembrane receptor protein
MARVGWKTPWEGVDMSLAWRYFGKSEQIGVTNLAKIDRSFGAENYFDLFGSWTINEKATVRLGINNVLDNDPQINNLVGTTGNGNTYPQTYDALGRYIFGGVKINF